ncbi:MAG: hypothetical protein EBZ36_12645 [Acidobacteria bacterium]|nr:hypothetical protein [Acidobacteriota bacterium]
MQRIVLLEFIRVLPERLRQTSDQLVIFLDDKRESCGLKHDVVQLLPLLPDLLSLLSRVGVE